MDARSPREDADFVSPPTDALREVPPPAPPHPGSDAPPPSSFRDALAARPASAYAMTFAVDAREIDALGHANNLSFVRWVQDVAVAHSGSVGWPLERYLALGGVFVVRRHEIDYVRPAFRGERLLARTWVEVAMAAKTLRATELLRADDEAVLCRARTTWGFVDATTGRPLRVPDEVRIAFGFPARPSRNAPPLRTD